MGAIRRASGNRTISQPEASDQVAFKPSKLGAEKLTPEEQRERFEALSRELGTDRGEALDAAFGKIVPPKVPSERPEIPSTDRRHPR